MFRRRRAPRTSANGPTAGLVEAFERTNGDVERARSSLVSAAPGRRGQRVPLAVALVGFEEALAQATESLDGWRSPEIDAEWVACSGALREARRRAEHLRLEASPQGYEELAPLLAALLEPLEAFDRAEASLRGWRG